MKSRLTIWMIMGWYSVGVSQSLQHNMSDAYSHRIGKEFIHTACLLADSLVNTGNYAEAESAFEVACSATDSLLKFHLVSSVKSVRIKSWGTIFDSYDKTARLYAIAGNPVKAKSYYEHSIQQRERFFVSKSVHRVAPHIGLGKMYYERGDYSQAFDSFERAEKLLSHATTSNYNYDVLHEELYYYWFEVNLRRGNLKKAGRYLDRYFLAVNTTSYSPEQLATCFEAKARYYLALNDLPNCDLYLKKAEGYLGSIAAFSRSRINILRTRALFLWRSRDITLSAAVFKKLIEAYRVNIEKNFPAMSDHEREQFYALLKNDFDLFNSFVLAEQSAGSAELFEVLYNNQLFTKALLLNEINKAKMNIMNSGDSALVSKLEQWQQGKEALALLYFNQRNAQGQIQALEQQLDDLEKEINRKSRLFTTSISEPIWQNVSSKLNKGEAAVEIIRVRPWQRVLHTDPAVHQYYFSDSVYYLFLTIHAGSEHPDGFTIPYGADLESKFLHFYRNSIMAKESDTVSYHLFWFPLQQHTQGFDRLFISADGVYNQINLNAIPNPVTGKFVIDEKDLVLVTNTKDLLAPSNANQARTADLYGKPAYSFKSDGAETPVRNNVKRAAARRSSLGADVMDLKAESFPELPGTEEEISAIGKGLMASGWKVHEYLGKEASETSLKSNLSPTVLHIATHGFFQSSNETNANPMIRSGLILSGVNNPEGMADDGILTAYEATNLNLDKTELVVLSACETGLGENKNGEGVYGLQRGFMVAGAKNMIMSLWRVDDFATSFLMSHFYSAWTSGTNVHEAFRRAQLELRANYPQPFYWSAFILLGN